MTLLSFPPSKPGVRENVGCMILAVLGLGALLFLASAVMGR